ncbi:hypothetical protein [Pseudoalteromonas pernae]|uniref:hypothetical protein n=1 Tax=Pseudoalteromonas pernae TaxID=3118054 RepID=UPI003242CB3A
MAREWVPFLKEEVDELYQLVIERFDDTFPDELVYRLIDIVESATMVEIDFGELLYCLEGCTSGYRVLDSREALDEYLAKKPGAISSMLANKTYCVHDSQSPIENFVQWAEDTQALIDKEGALVLSCSFTDGEGSEFYLISSIDN